MKKILLDSSKNFYKANMHCHSRCSDGKMTVDELKAHYKANGYSIIAFTDHEHLIDHSRLNDDSFLAITSCEIAIKEFERLSTLVKTDMRVCHLNIYAKDPSNVYTPCYSSVYDHFADDEVKKLIKHAEVDYKREYSGVGISKMIKEFNDRGFLVCYNHPRWSLENATDYLSYKGLWAVEIYNHTCSEDGLYEYDIGVYDDLLRSGEVVGCVAGDDNHKIETTCGGWTMINADSLDYTSIISALEKHDFYASTGPVIKELYIEDGKAYLRYEGGAFATISTRGRRAEKRIAEDEAGENIAVFELHPSDGYIRFDVVDSRGRRANTNAYFPTP